MHIILVGHKQFALVQSLGNEQTEIKLTIINDYTVLQFCHKSMVSHTFTLIMLSYYHPQLQDDETKAQTI